MSSIRIGVIGLGYVGLPLARLLATKYSVIGFDKKESRINELRSGIDTTLAISKETLNGVLKSWPNLDKGLFCTFDEHDLSICNFYIISVPTPVDDLNKPNLLHLYQASNMVGSFLKKEDIVVYESTVYPGATEEECVPILETTSGLNFNIDFFVGYSPERINPGDPEHTIETVLKVTSGSTKDAAIKIDALYASVIKAGTYRAPSIKVAEAAKVIENCQRDINIAFVNELAKIFNLLDIDTQEVLKTASTKWNFLPFKPGLVGGHCIGVDSYYLAHKAHELGYEPEIILAGRRMNDGMGTYVASEVIKLMVQNDIQIRNTNILVLGITFKENCPDVRNSKSVDVVLNLVSYGAYITVYDPWASPQQVKDEYNLVTTKEMPNGKYDAIVLTVAHKEFSKISCRELLNTNGVLYDVKGFLNETVDGRL